MTVLERFGISFKGADRDITLSQKQTIGAFWFRCYCRDIGESEASQANVNRWTNEYCLAKRRQNLDGSLAGDCKIRDRLRCSWDSVIRRDKCLSMNVSG